MQYKPPLFWLDFIRLILAINHENLQRTDQIVENLRRYFHRKKNLVKEGELQGLKFADVAQKNAYKGLHQDK